MVPAALILLMLMTLMLMSALNACAPGVKDVGGSHTEFTSNADDTTARATTALSTNPADDITTTSPTDSANIAVDVTVGPTETAYISDVVTIGPTETASHTDEDAKDEYDLYNIRDEKVATVYSPDGKYFIEGFGVDYSYSISGLNPVVNIRVVESDGGQTVWNKEGYFLFYQEPQFCWSPDSRYVSAAYGGRIWSHALVVDTKYMTEISLPGLDELAPLFPDQKADENRPDPYIIPQYWINEHSLVIEFTWNLADSPDYLEFSGEYIFDTTTSEFTIPTP